MNIFPSLISADLLNLEEQIALLEPCCAGFHIDIMDFHFVANLTWGPDFVNAIRAQTKKTLWVDLLVNNPEKYLDRLHLSAGDIVSFHIESIHSPDIVSQIKDLGLVASVALNSETSLDSIKQLLPFVDNVLVMSVRPGFSGQKFIVESLKKIEELLDFQAYHGTHFTLALDGGINRDTLPLIAPYNITMIAIASAIFSAQDYIKALKEINDLYGNR